MKNKLLKKFNEKLDNYCEKRVVAKRPSLSQFFEYCESVSFLSNELLESYKKSDIQIKAIKGELNEENTNSTTKLRVIRRILGLEANPKRKRKSKC